MSEKKKPSQKNKKKTDHTNKQVKRPAHKKPRAKKYVEAKILDLPSTPTTFKEISASQQEEIVTGANVETEYTQEQIKNKLLEYLSDTHISLSELIKKTGLEKSRKIVEEIISDLIYHKEVFLNADLMLVKGKPNDTSINKLSDLNPQLTNAQELQDIVPIFDRLCKKEATDDDKYFDELLNKYQDKQENIKIENKEITIPLPVSEERFLQLINIAVAQLKKDAENDSKTFYEKLMHIFDDESELIVPLYERRKSKNKNIDMKKGKKHSELNLKRGCDIRAFNKTKAELKAQSLDKVTKKPWWQKIINWLTN